MRVASYALCVRGPVLTNTAGNALSVRSALSSPDNIADIVCHALSGTDIAFPASRCATCIPFAGAGPSQLLLSGLSPEMTCLSSTRSSVLMYQSPYAISGTDMPYGHTPADAMVQLKPPPKQLLEVSIACSPSIRKKKTKTQSKTLVENQF